MPSMGILNMPQVATTRTKHALGKPAIPLLVSIKRELLLNEIGIQKRKHRSADVEPVFAQLKHNYGFRRFTLKGIKKVDLEFGLMVIAHNLRNKISA